LKRWQNRLPILVFGVIARRSNAGLEESAESREQNHVKRRRYIQTDGALLDVLETYGR